MAISEFTMYYTLNSLSLFWFAESVCWIFEISAYNVITADYTIIMSRALKATGNHVMYDRNVWFLRVIMSSSLALSRLLSVKKHKHDFFVSSLYNKTIITFSFCDIQVWVSTWLRLTTPTLTLADHPYLDLDYSGYHRNLIQ